MTKVKITDAAVQAALEQYSEGGCSGLADYERREVAIAMLDAAMPHLPLGYEVKKLEWVEGGSGFAVSKHFTKCGTYSITETKAGHFIVETNNSSTAVCSKFSLNEAKAAAKSDFERRVRECIVAKPVDVAAVLNSAALIVEGRSTAINSDLITSLYTALNGYEIAEIIAEHDKALGKAIRALSAETADRAALAQGGGE